MTRFWYYLIFDLKKSTYFLPVCFHIYTVRFTCRASVPGCCSSFTVLPPALFCPRPSCQVRFPPVLRLNCCLKSSGRALYSTAGLQKLKLDAAAEIRRWGIMTTSVSNHKKWHKPHEACLQKALCVTYEQKALWNTAGYPVIGMISSLSKYLLAHALLTLSRLWGSGVPKALSVWTTSFVFHESQQFSSKVHFCRACRCTSKMWDEPFPHHYEETGRQTREPAQQQVASQHPVIKGNSGTTVNTEVLALMLAESHGSLLIHAPDWKKFFLMRLKLCMQLCLCVR